MLFGVAGYYIFCGYSYTDVTRVLVLPKTIHSNPLRCREMNNDRFGLGYGTHALVLLCGCSFYRAMHFSANARSWDRMSSVRPSVTLVDCDHIGWKSWKLITRTISATYSLFVAKRRFTYSQGNLGEFGETRGGVGKKWHAGEQKRQYL